MKTASLKIQYMVIGWFFLFIMSTPLQTVRADLFGGDVVVLSQILTQAIDQVFKLQQIIGKAQQTVSILEDMNRGVKEVLRLSETAHIPIPSGVYAQAKTIDQAVSEARKIYGDLSEKIPSHTRIHYQSGTEGLSLSQDAFDYSTFLDVQGESIKRSAVLANQASATRLTAETLGVLLHAVSQTHRLQAKSLEMASSDRIEHSAQEGARFDSFLNTQQHIENILKEKSISSLNEIIFERTK